MVDLELWNQMRNANNNNEVSTLKALISQRPSPETLNHGDPKWYDGTLLSLAAYNGRLEVARLLIEAGASVDVTDKFGGTPLHDASVQGHLEVAKLLVEAGANPNVKNNDGKTPRQVAHDKGHRQVDHMLNDAAQIQRAALKKAEELRRQNAEQQAEIAKLQAAAEERETTLTAKQQEVEQLSAQVKALNEQLHANRAKIDTDPRLVQYKAEVAALRHKLEEQYSRIHDQDEAIIQYEITITKLLKENQGEKK